MRLEDTDLYKRLQTLNCDVAAILKHYIETQFVPLLNNIKIKLPEYTSHGENHSINVLDNMWKIIPQETRERLSLVEVILLIYSAYLHDIGMFINDSDINSIPNNPEYKIFKAKWLKIYDKDVEEIEILKDFVRNIHAQRSEQYIENKKNLFVISEINYSSILKRICGGHILNIEQISQYCENSKIANYCVNEKYLTIILRIADLLDIYPNRTPCVLYEKIKPKNKISIQEWEKHLSITGWEINDAFIEIHAECSEYNTERVLRDFIKYINSEIKDSYLCLGCKNDKYLFNLKGDISVENINSDGSYIYNELKFELNTANIISLLMGNRLYSRPEYALRELLQNSIDAVLYRKKIEELSPSKEKYYPQIAISFDNNVLSIEDNGIGMDIEIFKKYFMNIGKSYYKSSDAIERVKDFLPISEFGIGILSTFMVADNISVESKLRPDNLNNASVPILIDVPTLSDYFIQKYSNKQEFGTKITLNLKENHPFANIDICEFITKHAPLINSQIKLSVNGEDINNSRQDFYKSLIDFRMCDELYSFNINSDLYGVYGQVFFIKEQEEYVKCESIIAKNGFQVNNQDLIPNWANFKVVLNITNPSIKLSANREVFVINEEYYKLKSFLKTEIENEFYNYLLSLKNNTQEEQYIQYLYNLISDKLLFNNSHMKSNEIIPERIQELILLPVIDINNNEQYKSIKELLLSRNIVTYSKVPQKYKKKFEVPYQEIFEKLNKYSLSNTFLINNKINSNATQIILSVMGLYVEKFVSTSVQGFNIFILSKNIFDINYSWFWHSKNFSSNIDFCSNQKKLFLQLEPENFVLGYPDIVFNVKHELIQPYLNIDNLDDTYSSGEIRKIFKKLEEQINKSFGLYSCIFRKNITKATIKKDYMIELNKIAKQLWGLYEKNNLIPQGCKFKKITEKDFPFGLSVKF